MIRIRLVFYIVFLWIVPAFSFADTCGDIIKVVAGSVGPGVDTLATDPETPSLPDLITNKLWLETPWGEEIYVYDLTEELKMKAQIKNIGEGNPYQIVEGHFYLSKGYKEDPHSEWERKGTDFTQPENLLSGQTHTETEGMKLWEVTYHNRPLTPGMWNIVFCPDHTKDDHNEGGEIEEEHESNNCSTPAVFEVRDTGAPINSPKYDFEIHSLQLTNTSTPVPVGGKYGAKFAVRNIGNTVPPTGIRSVYEIKGPQTNDQWQFVADDGTDAGELAPNENIWEQILSLVTAPTVPGIYTLRARADYQNAVAETNEENNSAEIQFEVKAQPRIVVTNPTTGDDWESNKRKHITWNRYDFPTAGNVKIEYTMNGGSTWKTIESSTSNDGSRYWEMCGYSTTDSSNSYIRISSKEYPIAVGVSNRFTIDHKKGCK